MAASTELISGGTRLLLRMSIALVWLYQGLWHKVLAVEERHLRIVEQAVGAGWGRVVLGGLGGLETLLGLCVLTCRWPMPTAWAQIVLLAGMNTMGLLSAADQIPDPMGMVTMNIVFCVAAWINGRLSMAR